MRNRTGKLASLALGVLALGTGGQAGAAAAMSGAEKLHRLDVMLQVNAARCERTGAAFGADYGAFAGAHRTMLDRASRDFRMQLGQRYGLASDRAFARANVALAGEYAAGHPWLGCGDLKTVAQGLALVEGSATLLEAADQILPHGGVTHAAFVRQ
jgi:hypothetical protein